MRTAIDSDRIRRVIYDRSFAKRCRATFKRLRSTLDKRSSPKSGPFVSGLRIRLLFRIGCWIGKFGWYLRWGTRMLNVIIGGVALWVLRDEAFAMFVGNLMSLDTKTIPC